MEFYKVIKFMYLDIELIFNCDGLCGFFDYFVDLYDYYVRFFDWFFFGKFDLFVV